MPFELRHGALNSRVAGNGKAGLLYVAGKNLPRLYVLNV